MSRKLRAVQKRAAKLKAPFIIWQPGDGRGAAGIALAVGEVLNAYNMKKHFDLDITDTAFSFARKTAEIAAEAATDGL